MEECSTFIHCRNQRPLGRIRQNKDKALMYSIPLLVFEIIAWLQSVALYSSLSPSLHWLSWLGPGVDEVINNHRLLHSNAASTIISICSRRWGLTIQYFITVMISHFDNHEIADRQNTNKSFEVQLANFDLSSNWSFQVRDVRKARYDDGISFLG